MDLDSGMEFDLRLDFLNAEVHGVTINPKEVRSSQLDNSRSEVISGKAQVKFKTLFQTKGKLPF